MKETLDILKSTDVISSENVSSLKKYIVKKYPDCDYKKQTEIFADSVHKILDRNLMPFDSLEKDNIKGKVLVNAVNKKEFSINAYEIFRECIVVNNGEKEYCRNMEKWLNSQNNVSVDPLKFNFFMDKVWQGLGGNIDETINRAAEEVNEKIRGNDIQTNILQIHSIEENPEAYGDNSEILNKFEGTVQNESGKTEITFFQAVYLLLQSYCRRTKIFVRDIFKQLFLVSAYRKRIAIYFCAVFMIVFLGAYSVKTINENHQKTVPVDYELISKGDMGITDGLSDEFKYTEISNEALKGWLDSKNSILSDDKYLSPIVEAAREYDVNPLLLFAITGQEQGFVPRNVKNADKIANNPFNVFGSWQNYNTSIKDSACLAAATIVDSSMGRPVNADELEWINKRYAQDPKWWVGVTKIFYQMKKDILDK